MSEIFNITRFGWIFKKTVLERPMQLIGLIGAILAITLIIYEVVQSGAGVGKAQGTSFMFGFVIGGSFIASTVFNFFSSNASGSSYLMIPASHLEKWLCGILISGVFFTIAFLCFFKTMDTIFVNSYRHGLDRNSTNYKFLYNSVEMFPLNSGIAKVAYMLMFNTAGAMLVGSLYFNKVSFIKTLLIICGLIMGCYLLNLLIASFLFKNIDTAMPFNSIFIKANNGVGIIDMPSEVNNILSALITYIIPVVLWLTAYIRLVEKEI